MKYYLSENLENATQFTAATKARDDAAYILENNGFKPFYVNRSKTENKNIISKIKISFEAVRLWKAAAESLKPDDILLIQFPLNGDHSIFFLHILKMLKKKGVKTIALIHDLETLREALSNKTSFKSRVLTFFEERLSLKHFGRIILHNDKMAHIMLKNGLKKEQITELEIFDYVIDKSYEKKCLGDENAVIIAGNLEKTKAGYAYALPSCPDAKFSLYGINYTGKTDENIQYHGAFEPDEIPFVINGRFGLVWDGSSEKTCAGICGEYLKINNPHKTSLYLAAGIPVIIWEEAALASFITKNGAGITVKSLLDLPEILSALSDEEYQKMKSNAIALSEKLKKGYYLTQALKKCGI